jgi:DNA-binding NarL/FixJ family response regulator
MSRRPPSGRDLRVTNRQRQILDLAVRGLTDKEIAADLSVAVSTIRTHLERFYRENGLRNKTSAVAAWQHYIDAQRQRKRSAP